MTTAVPNREPHEITDACRAMHCFGHDIDEPLPEGRNPYLVCGECYHYFPSARALRRDYRRGAVPVYRDELRNPTSAYTPTTPARPSDDDPFGGPIMLGPLDVAETFWSKHPRLDALRHIAALLFLRAKKISFCPHCIHDF